MKKMAKMEKATFSATTARAFYEDGMKIKTPHSTVYWLKDGKPCMRFIESSPNEIIENKVPPFDLYPDGWELVTD